MDENLGPAILQRSERINQALKDHLEDPQTFKQLPEHEATTAAVTALAQTVKSFVKERNGSFTKMDQTCLFQSLSVEDPVTHFPISTSSLR